MSTPAGAWTSRVVRYAPSIDGERASYHVQRPCNAYLAESNAPARGTAAACGSLYQPRFSQTNNSENSAMRANDFLGSHGRFAS